MLGNEDKSTSGKNPDIEDEATRVDSGTKSTDVEEFVSESYLASSKDIAEADESIKRLRVSGMTHEQNNSANLEFPLHKRQSINDVMLIFRVFGPPPPLSRIHATYQYCFSHIG